MNTKDDFSYNESRFSQTVDFIGNVSGIALDIGERNNLSKYIESRNDVTIINTVSDLDYSIEYDYSCSLFDTVFCFEVIEHLLNPRMFFDNLSKIINRESNIFLSYPSRPKFLWNNDEHFHEYDRLRFDYLLEKTGFRIVREKNIYVRRKPIGIRPIIRNFIPQTRIFLLKKI